MKKINGKATFSVKEKNLWINNKNKMQSTDYSNRMRIRKVQENILNQD